MSQDQQLIMPPIEIICQPSVSAPSRATDGSAGYDLVVPYHEGGTRVTCTVGAITTVEEEVFLDPRAIAVFEMGFAIHISDPNWEAQIRARSGLATKRGLMIPNGVGTVDSDYQGEVCVALFNASNVRQSIKPGDRIAQLVFAYVGHPEFKDVSVFSVTTDRGTGGFGSTDVSRIKTRESNS